MEAMRAKITSDLTTAMNDTMAAGFDVLSKSLGKSHSTLQKGMLARMAKAAKRVGVNA